LLGHHPRKWDWDSSAKEFLPHLDIVQVTPGCGGVSEANGVINPSRLLAACQEAGRCIIRNDDKRLPFPYVTRAKVAGGTADSPCYAYFPAWMKPVDVAGKLFWEGDVSRRQELQRALLKKGIVSPIEPSVKELLLKRKRTRVERLENELDGKPDSRKVQARLATATDALESMTVSQSRASAVESKDRTGAPPTPRPAAKKAVPTDKNPGKPAASAEGSTSED